MGESVKSPEGKKEARTLSSRASLGNYLSRSLGRLALGLVELLVNGAHKSLQLILLLRVQYRSPVLKRFDALITKLRAKLFTFLNLGFDLNQVRGCLPGEAKDFLFQGRQLLLERRDLTLVMASNLFQIGHLLASQVELALMVERDTDQGRPGESTQHAITMDKWPFAGPLLCNRRRDVEDPDCEQRDYGAG